MATEAQIAANRANAQKSTGPKTPPGKAASSRNSTVHGLSGSTAAALVASESDRAFVEAEKAKWRADFDPRGPEEERLFEAMVVESIRVGRCVDAYFALCREHGERARTQWDADRRCQADELASRLAREPHKLARRIAGTPQGCELMLECWRGLSSSLERHRTWTDAQRSLALDLLGIRPELRDAETPVDPAGGDALEARRAVVASEIGRLESLRDGALRERDAAERALAESTLGAELTRPLQLMHRYEMAALRREERARRRLDAARAAREHDAPPAPRHADPAPAPQPAPRPAPPASAQAARPAIVATPTPVAAVPAPAARPATPAAPSAPLNRRQRRAQAALARRSGR
jgi:hypothetical protein